MGAHNFREFVADQADVAEAYHAVCDERQYMDGHDGYNGTISTTHGYTLLQQEAISLKEARLLADYHEEFDEEATVPVTWRGWRPEKRGSAGALPILHPSCVKLRTAKATVTLTQSGYISESELIAFAKDKIKLKPGERIIGAKALSDELKRKVSQSATEGKAVTRYLITNPSSRRIIGEATGYASMALARAAAKTLAQGGTGDSTNPNDAELVISGIITREGGGPLVVTRSSVQKRKLVIEVQITRPPAKPKHGGWFFFGTAAS